MTITLNPPYPAPVCGYDAEGKCTIYYLNEGESLPAGMSETTPPGTHPHDLDGTNGTPPPPPVTRAAAVEDDEEEVEEPDETGRIVKRKKRRHR
jgi:hypothetical protein